MNILVTAIGSMSADCVVNRLNDMGHNVIGCDIYPPHWHAITKYFNSVYQAPYASQTEEYINFLLHIALENNIEYIIPLTDIEIDVINMHRDLFESKGICLCMPNADVLKIARDKYQLYSYFVEDKTIPSIITYKSGQVCISDPIFPYIAKPINGRSSEGIVYINSLTELDQINSKENYLIQHCIKGNVYTVDYVRSSLTMKDCAIPREELLRTKNGAGTTISISNNAKLIALVSYIGAKLNINGCVNIEFIENEGEFYMIDINPRFSAGVAFSYKVGYDMVKNHMNCYQRNDIDPSICLEEQIIVKRYTEECLNYSKTI